MSEAALLTHIRAIHAQSKGNYGRPRILRELRGSGLRVGELDGYRLNRYRESVGVRTKTDASHARLRLLRYVMHEHGDLRSWSPPPKGYTKFQHLLRRRAVLIQARATLRQSLTCMHELKPSVKAVLNRMSRLDALICKRIKQALTDVGWAREAQRCKDIESIGPITGAALTMIFRRWALKSADAFIAFIGMGVRVRESGTFRGRRKLTKKGVPELRRLLYMAATRSDAWKSYYERCLSNDKSSIQALVALGRKLARIAFDLLKNGSTYTPKVTDTGCATT